MVDQTVSDRPTEALPRNQRIQKRRDFLRVYGEGLKSFGRYVVVFALANELGHPRIGITVTRKFGKALDRNRAKRRVREVFRRNRESSGFSVASFDLVINVKPTAVDTGFVQFADDLLQALRKAMRPGVTSR